MLRIDAVDAALKDLEFKAKESEAIIQKLNIVESRYEELTSMKKEIFDKNKVIEDLSFRINALDGLKTTK